MKSSIPGGSTAARLTQDTTAYPRTEAAGMVDETDMDNDNSGQGEISVPVDALAVDGTAPETGDVVSFTVSGTVSRMDGSMAVVRVEKVNDEQVKPAGRVGSEEDQMRDMASAADADPDNNLYR